MKITITSWGKGYQSSGIETKIETSTGIQEVEFRDGEPEDMYIARDLSDAKRIWRLLETAYYAGKNGEDIQIINIDKVNEEDE